MLTAAQRRIAETLKRHMQLQGMAVARLAEESGIHRTHISSFLNPKPGDNPKGPSQDTIQRLANALKADPRDFFEKTPAVQGPSSMPMLLMEVQQRYEAIDILEVPLRGTVPSKEPLPERTDEGDFIPLSRVYIPPEVVDEHLFAVRMTGNALQGDGVRVGDILIVEKNAPLIDGAIYLVQLETGVIARHVYIGQGRLQLVSSTGVLTEVDSDAAEIIGRVVLSGGWNRH